MIEIKIRERAYGSCDQATPEIRVSQHSIDVTGSDSQILFEDLPVDDPKVRRPDIARARELLGWEPTVELRDGLAKTRPWFEQRIGTGAQEPVRRS